LNINKNRKLLKKIFFVFKKKKKKNTERFIHYIAILH